MKKTKMKHLLCHIISQLSIEMVWLKIPQGLVLKPLLHIVRDFIYNSVHCSIGCLDVRMLIWEFDQQVAVHLGGWAIQANLQ